MPPPAPVVELVPVRSAAPLTPVVVTPPPVDAPPDAGMLAEVVIELVQNGQQLIGTRVELEGPGGRVSRPTDVMGFARFTLPTGSWRIIKPRLTERPVPYDGGSERDWALAVEQSTTVPLEVVAPLTQFRHELPSTWRYRLRVVDARGAPVLGARVSWGSLGRTQLSDALGEVTFETTEPTVQVQASVGSARSIVRTAAPGQLTTLVLEEWTHLEVKVTGGTGSAFIRVMHRDEIVAAGFFGEPIQVPVGVLSVLARRNLKGRVHSGKARVEARAGLMNKVDLELSPSPPITGKVVDASGRAMPGVGVHVREVALAELLEIARERPGADLDAIGAQLKLRADGGTSGLAASVRTDSAGEFAWTPTSTSGPDPLFQVVVVELWRTRAETVLVKLDDAPLTVEVVPAP